MNFLSERLWTPNLLFYIPLCQFKILRSGVKHTKRFFPPPSPLSEEVLATVCPSYTHNALADKKDGFFLPFSLFAAKPARAIKMKIGGAEKEIIVGFSSSFSKEKKAIGSYCGGLVMLYGKLLRAGEKNRDWGNHE